MKVPINVCAVIDLDAPPLPTERVKTRLGIRWRVWCKHRNAWHLLGARERHSEAHSNDAWSSSIVAGAR